MLITTHYNTGGKLHLRQQDANNARQAFAEMKMDALSWEHDVVQLDLTQDDGFVVETWTRS